MANQKNWARKAGFRRRCLLECLEERKVLATLIIDAGTANDDQIEISSLGGDLVVNGEVESLSGFDTVQINAAGGNDTIHLVSLPVGSGGVSEVQEVAGLHDTCAAAQVLPSVWSLTPDQNINDDFDNAADHLPHITVKGSFDGNIDIYKFHVSVGVGQFVTGYFDIDAVDQTKFDAYLELLDASGTPIPFAASDSSPVPDLDRGSSPYNAPANNDTYDPILSFIFPEGSHDYYLVVKESPDAVVHGSTTYDLQLVVPTMATGGGPAPTIIINGGDGNDTLNVAAGLMPLSATDENVVVVGQTPFSGTLFHGSEETASYTSVETFNGGTAFTVRTDLVALLQQDGIADTTWVRGNGDGTKLLVDVNGTTYFAGGLDHILIAAVDGSSDADTILVENTAVKAHIDGRAGDDTITTADAPDIVYGGSGNDVISTGGGNDYVAGGDDNDTIFGGDGDDSLHGNAGDDILAGQAGHDIVTGGSGNDQLSGHQGQDVLIGGSGADQVIGNNDRDLLFAAGVAVVENEVSIPLGESDSSEHGDDNYFRLQDLREDWLDVVALALGFGAFASKYDSGVDDGVEDKLQGGSDDDVFFSDGSAKIIDSAFDRETTS